LPADISLRGDRDEQVERANEGGSSVERLQTEYAKDISERGKQFREIFRQVTGGAGQRGSEEVLTPSDE
jgi:hypothetical protein